MTTLKKKKSVKKKLVIYQAKSGAIELQGDFANETIYSTCKKSLQVEYR